MADTIDRWVTAYDLGEESFRITAENEVASGAGEAVAEMKGAMSEIEGMSAEAKVGIETARAMAEIRKIDAELKKIAAMKVEAKAGMDTGPFDRAAAGLQAKKELLERKIEIPVDFDRSTLDRGTTALNRFSKGLNENEGHLGNWFRSLGKVRVQAGFLSGTVRQMALGFTLLGPVVFSVIGTLSSLVGVLGTGLTGAATVAGAAITGFGLSAIGIFTGLKPLLPEVGARFKVLAGEFQKLTTSQMRAPLFGTVSEAMKTAHALMPAFARESVGTFKALTDGTNKWLEALRSPEAQQAINTIMSNFRQSLPALMQGFGSVGAALGRVLASASKSLPDLNRGFAQWANNLARSIGSGDALDQKIGRLVDHMQSVGHLAQQSGRLLVNFFNSGANTGQGLVDSLTATFTQWNAWMQSVQGQTSLQRFFTRSADLARQLGPAILRIGTALANVSTAAEPLSLGVAKGLNAIATVAAALPPPLLQAAGAFYILNKAMTLFTTGKLATMIGTTLGPAIKGLVPLVSALSTAFRVGGLATALEQVSAAGLGAGLALTGAGAVFGGVVIGATILSNKMDEMSESTRQSIERFQHQNDLVNELPTSFAAYQASMRTTKQAQDALNQSIKKTGENSHETAVATKTLNQAIKEQNAEMASLRARGLASFNQGMAESARSTTNLNNYLASTDPFLTDMASSFATASGRGREFTMALMRNGQSVAGVAKSLQQAGLSVKQLGLQNLPMLQNAFNQFNQTQQRAATNVVNYARSLKGLAPITGAASSAVGKFVQQFGKVSGAKKAVISTNAPEQASKIARLSTSLGRLGQRPAVVRILMSDKDAQGKIDALTRKKDQFTKSKAQAKLDVQDSGVSAKVANAKQKLTGFATKYDATMHVLGAGAAQSAAQMATSAVNAFPTGTRTMNLVTNYTQHGHPPGGGYAGGVFPGGIPGFAAGATEKMMSRAISSAGTRQPREGAKGAKVTRPTYITGEQNRSEYVIATNPAYRRANVGYLLAAASDLGVLLAVPGYAKGKKGGKGKAKAQPGGNLDNATGPDSKYQELEDLVNYDSEIAALVKRQMDLGQGKSLADVVAAINTEKADYGTLASLIQTMITSGLVVPYKSKQIPKEPKSKFQEKHPAAAKKQSALRQTMLDHNAAIKSGKQSLQDELRSIRNVILPGLDLDIIEAQTGAQANAIAGTESMNKSQYDVLRNFASNIIGSSAITVPSLGGGGLGTSETTPPLVGSVATLSGGSSAGPLAATSVSSGSTVIVNNTFTEAPSDPLTWSAGINFELQGMGV